MTLASLTTLITLQYQLVPTSDPMMLILLIIAGWYILKFLLKALVFIVGSLILFVQFLVRFIPYFLTGRVEEYFTEREEEKRQAEEDQKKKDRERWEEHYRTDRVTRVCFPDKELDEKYGFTEEIRGDRKAKDWYD